MARTEGEFLKEILAFAKTHEFSTFWLAVVLSSAMEKNLSLDAREKEKSRIKRTLGMSLEANPSFGKKAQHDEPDVLFTLNFHSGKLKAGIKPLLIYGRYCKNSREIPQSKWPCKRCSGAGCAHCKGKGAMYEETVEGFLAPLLKASGAKETKMHACGREDIDARTLGTGRPFILELVSPRKRSLNLARLLTASNKLASKKASFSELSFATQPELDKLNSSRADKTYLVTATCKRALTKKDLQKLLRLKGKIISQHTPTRVLHRRADLLRKRKVKSISAKQLSPKSVSLKLLVQSGTYVKELVTGDNNRTRPSVSSILGQECAASDLDVLAVHFSLPRRANSRNIRQNAKV